MKWVTRTVVLFLILFGATAMADKQSKSPVWIDVRTAEEYAGGHYSSAVNIPHTVIKSKISEVTTDKDADIHVYCRSGRRSAMAKADLEKLGYTNVINEGGYSDVLKKMRK